MKKSESNSFNACVRINLGWLLRDRIDRCCSDSLRVHFHSHLLGVLNDISGYGISRKCDPEVIIGSPKQSHQTVLDVIIDFVHTQVDMFVLQILKHHPTWLLQSIRSYLSHLLYVIENGHGLFRLLR